MALTKPAGEWRYEDLERLPDDGKRYEIIGGVLYEMPAANLIHATILMHLLGLLMPMVAALRGRLYAAPVDVFFHDADPVQPDIAVILPGWEGTLRRRGLEGAPDLVIEVLSLSNRGHDLLTKRSLYARGGVREYWIVDPDHRTVEVLVLGRDAFQPHLVAAEGDAFASPLLGDTSFSTAAVFADLDQISD